MIAFSKYHGCGNSFIICDYDNARDHDLSLLATYLCNTSIGIGADGLIVVKREPLEMIFFNQDGTEAPMCGNGIRCFAKYVTDKKYETNESFEVQTLAGKMQIKKSGSQYEIDMGTPQYDRKQLGLNEDVELEAFEVCGMKASSIFIGTVHTVIFVDQLDEVDVEDVGYRICNDPMFQQKTNVNFVEVVDYSNIKVSTYERGVGITKACGTGCCASVVYANKFKMVGDIVSVHLEYGSLEITYQNNKVKMKGPATFVCEGSVQLKEDIIC